MLQYCIVSERPRHPRVEYPVKPEPKTVSLDEQTALKLLIASYDHSQGNQALQHHLFDYLHLIQPDWRIKSTLRQSLTAHASQVISKLFAREGFHLATGLVTSTIFISASISGEVQAFTTSLKGRNEQHPLETLLPIIVAKMVSQDYIWIVQTGNGRQHRRDATAHNSRYSPRHDPYFSYLCYYALERYTTGIAELDQLYQDIKTYLLHPLLNPIAEDNQSQTHEAFAELLVAYKQQHPHHRIDGRLPRE